MWPHPNAREPGMCGPALCPGSQWVQSEREVGQAIAGKGSSLIKRDFKQDAAFVPLGMLSCLDVTCGTDAASLAVSWEGTATH